MHCCGSNFEDETLSVRVADGGGGPYIVLNATEWSLESLADIEKLQLKLEAFLTTAQRTHGQKQPGATQEVLTESTGEPSDG